LLLPGLIAPGSDLATTKPGPAKAPVAQAPSGPKQAACSQTLLTHLGKARGLCGCPRRNGEITEDLLIAATAQGA